MAQKKKKPSITQKNIDKINRNLRSIAKTFGKTSKAYEEASAKAYLSGLKIYDRLVDGDYVIQIANTKKNRKHHQMIRSLTKSRKSIATLKRNYMPKDYDDPIFEHDASEASDGEPSETFEQWYSRISSEIFDFLDELYALSDSLDLLEIPYDENMLRLSHDYRETMWEQVFNALIADTKKAKEFYDVLGFGLADTGEVITEELNTDPTHNDQSSLFDESWFDDEFRRNKRKRR